MKAFKKIIAVTTCFTTCITSALFAGCNQKTYSFYTNVPSGEYKIIDPSFKLGSEIEGYTPPANEKVIAPANYTSKGQSFFSMFTFAELAVADDFTADGATEKYNSFVAEVGQLLDNVSKTVSSTVSGSDIYSFNEAGAGAKLEISKIAYEILSEAKAVYTLTDGYYNPALYYNIHAYGFSGSHVPECAADLPDDEIIEKYTRLANRFGEIQLTKEEQTSAKTNETTYKYFVQKPDATEEVDGKKLTLKLDLGGIAKGYAVDMVDEVYEKYGYKFGKFNFGSSSMLAKSHPENGNFKIMLGNPRSPKRDSFLQFHTNNEKFSTSGDNEQFYEIDGVRYCHIIDPTTGKPVRKGIMSVTIVGGGAAQADALTTAIMAMGKDRATVFIKENLNERKVFFTVE